VQRVVEIAESRASAAEWRSSEETGDESENGDSCEIRREDDGDLKDDEEEEAADKDRYSSYVRDLL